MSISAGLTSMNETVGGGDGHTDRRRLQRRAEPQVSGGQRPDRRGMGVHPAPEAVGQRDQMNQDRHAGNPVRSHHGVGAGRGSVRTDPRAPPGDDLHHVRRPGRAPTAVGHRQGRRGSDRGCPRRTGPADVGLAMRLDHQAGVRQPDQSGGAEAIAARAKASSASSMRVIFGHFPDLILPISSHDPG